MGWIGGIIGLALLALVVAVGTDVYLTKCQPGSFYGIVGLCSPPTAGSETGGTRRSLMPHGTHPGRGLT